MAEYVNKTVIVDMLRAKAELGRASGYGACFDNAAKMVELLPAADVAPVRHKWEKFVRTQRTDRTGIDRTKLPQDEPQDFTGEANAQHLIDTWRKRLCYQASPETRAYAEDFKATLYDVQPEISDVLVPNCVYRGGCPEMTTCGLWERLVALSDGLIVTDNIQKRYDIYNVLANKEFWRIEK